APDHRLSHYLHPLPVPHLTAPAYYFPSSAVVRGRRALPSFPTRRSSDLWISSALSASPAAISFGGASTTSTIAPQGAMVRSTIRSEEHTSELQSRFDLVCRLLLEKKKRKLTRKRRLTTYQQQW